MSRRLPIGLVVLLAAAMLVGCSPVLETDQARLCRMALPALMPEGARIAIQAQTPDPDGRGLSVAFTAQTPGEEPAASPRRLPLSRARTAARIARSDVAHARRRARLGSPALLSRPLLAGDAGGPRRRSRAARRRERASPSRRTPSPMACKWRWTGCRSRRSMRCSRRPIRSSTASSAGSISPSAKWPRPAATRRRSRRSPWSAGRRRRF